MFDNALTPSSIDLKPLACQNLQRIRSDPRRQRPLFTLRISFAQRRANLGESSCSLLNPAQVASFFFFSLSVLSFPLHTTETPDSRALVLFPGIHATLPRSSISPTNSHRTQSRFLQPTHVVHSVYSSCRARPSGMIRQSPVGFVSFFLRYADSSPCVQVIDLWLSLSN